MRKALAVLVLAVLFVSAIGPGAGQEGEDGEEEIIVKETRITHNLSSQHSPNIWGDNIVWTDERNEDGDIFFYNISSKSEIRITNDSIRQQYPSISENIIVWTDWRDLSLHYYDINLKEEKSIGINKSIPIFPKVHKDFIVWLDYYEFMTIKTEIYAYNLRNEYEIPIRMGDESTINWNPNIWGNRIVWSDNRTGYWDIYLYDIDKSQEIQITNNNYSQVVSAIWKNRVVWLDYRHSPDSDSEKPDIYYYDINEKEEKRITNKTASWGEPAIWGDNVVWTHSSLGKIYLYNIPTEKTYLIDTERVSSDISIYENNIVFADKRNGNLDIYMVEFTLPPQPSDPSFWEQNRMPIGLGIVFIMVATILVILFRGKKGKNKESIDN